MLCMQVCSIYAISNLHNYLFLSLILAFKSVKLIFKEWWNSRAVSLIGVSHLNGAPRDVKVRAADRRGV